MTERWALSIAEFAEAVGISRSHAYRLIAGGAVRSVALGGRRVVPLAVIEGLLAEQTDQMPEGDQMQIRRSNEAKQSRQGTDRAGRHLSTAPIGR